MRASHPGAAWSRCCLLVAVAALLLAVGATARAGGADSDRLAAAATSAGAPAGGAVPDAYAPKAHIVSFGLWGLQNVFRTEANQAAAVLHAYYGRGGQVVVRANARNSGGVTAAMLQSTLRSVAAQMNKDDDLLVLVLTTHGSPQGLAIKYGQHSELL